MDAKLVSISTLVDIVEEIFKLELVKLEHRKLTLFLAVSYCHKIIHDNMLKGPCFMHTRDN